MKTYNLFFIILALFLVSCNRQIPQDSIGIIHPQDVIKVSAVIGDFYNNSYNTIDIIPTIEYNNQFDSISTYGIDKERIKQIIKNINSDYFKGISNLEVIHSKKQDALRMADGWYYPDNAKITIYAYDESDGWIKALLLHELKHHYCWVSNRSLEHDGCFLDTPIDREYGQIR